MTKFRHLKMITQSLLNTYAHQNTVYSHLLKLWNPCVFFLPLSSIFHHQLIGVFKASVIDAVYSLLGCNFNGPRIDAMVK